MASVTTRLHAGVGTSAAEDGRKAAAEATSAAMSKIGGARPDLVLAYASDRYHLTHVLETINEVTGGAPLAGATAGTRVFEGSVEPSLTVLVLAGGGYRFHVSHVTGVAGRAAEAGRKLARAARGDQADRDDEHEAFLLLSDALIGDQQGLLVGVYQVAGFAAPVFGGVAGTIRFDDPDLGYGTRTFVFHDGQAYADAAVAVRIGSPRPLHIAVGQGWHPTGMPTIVTDVDGSLLKEVAGQPASEYFRDSYRRLDIGDDRSKRLVDWVHALGLIQPDGSMLIRSTYVDPGGAVRTFSPVPEYAAVQTVYSEPDEVLSVGEQTVAEAIDGFRHTWEAADAPSDAATTDAATTDAATEVDPAVLLLFDCVSRLDILGPNWRQEGIRLQQAAGLVPTFTLPSYGEFARLTSVAGFHNASIVAVAL